MSKPGAAPLFKPDEAARAGAAAALALDLAAWEATIAAAVSALCGLGDAGSGGVANTPPAPLAFAFASRALTAAARADCDAAGVSAAAVAAGLDEGRAAALRRAASASAAAVREALCGSVPGAPRLVSLRSRVDVAIASASLTRVMRPVVTLEAALSDGAVHTFEVRALAGGPAAAALF
jgi:hypothetical protein